MSTSYDEIPLCGRDMSLVAAIDALADLVRSVRDGALPGSSHTSLDRLRGDRLADELTVYRDHAETVDALPVDHAEGAAARAELGLDLAQSCLDLLRWLAAVDRGRGHGARAVMIGLQAIALADSVLDRVPSGADREEYDTGIRHLRRRLVEMADAEAEPALGGR